MKILYLTGIHPTPDNKSAGSFITKRLEKIRENEIDFKVIAPYQKELWDLKFAKKILNKSQSKDYPINMEVRNIVYNFLPVEINLFHQSNKGKYGKKMADEILESTDIYNYDLIHAHWAYPHGYAAYLISSYTGIPYVLSVHGSDIHTHPYNNNEIRSLTLYALEYAEKVFFVSNYLLKEACKLGYSGKNSMILYNGVDSNLFIPKEGHLDIEVSTSKRIGFVGRLHKIKRADKLADIFKEIALKMKNVEFVIVGDGPLIKQIKSRCKDYGLSVKFMGNLRVEDVPNVINSFDVLVLPSRNEGLPNVVLEAKSCGIPTVGTNIGGISEAIGEDGIVVDEGSTFINDFSEAVVTLLNSKMDKEKIRNNALKFNWDKAINEQLMVYNEVLVNRS